MRDSDTHLFNTNQVPQYPSKCLCKIRERVLRHSDRRLRELNYVSKKEATAACSVHHSGPLQNFYVDDVLMTGDLDSTKDRFYW